MGFSELLATADRAVRDMLGDAVTYAPSSGAPVVVRGIFDAAYVRAEVGEAGLSTSSPAVFLRLEELPSDPDVDEPLLTVGGVTYRPHECEKDGQGGVRVLLHRI